MRTLEVRRHAATKKGEGRGRGSHLSQAGVDAARRLGESLGPFAFVLASDVPRTSETALAMGYAVDDVVEFGGPDFEAASRDVPHHLWWEVEEPFRIWSDHLATGGAVARFARHQESTWRRTVLQVPDGGAALVISHGGLVESGLVACFPEHDHRAWNGPFANLEGARLRFDGDGWVAIELLRIAIRLTSPVRRRAAPSSRTPS